MVKLVLLQDILLKIAVSKNLKQGLAVFDQWPNPVPCTELHRSTGVDHTCSSYFILYAARGPGYRGEVNKHYRIQKGDGLAATRHAGIQPPF